MAISTGKNKAKTGTKIVPSPKPEKSVSPEPSKAAKQIIKYSIKSNVNNVGNSLPKNQSYTEHQTVHL